MSKVLKRDFLVIASQRSGHHAVMGWILSAFPQPRLFLNHVHPKSGKVLGSEGYHGRVKKIKKEEEVNCLLYNIENIELHELDSYKITKQRSKIWLPKHESERRDLIMVIRDPFNTLAAAVKLGQPRYPPGKIKKMAKRLVQHYKFVDGQNKPTQQQPYVISFNEWFASPEYRAKIVKDLDLNLDPEKPYTELRGRSSFDLRKHKTTAHKMDVLNRYKEMMKNPLYRELFEKQPKLVTLGEKLFGMNPF